jgi:hypothetical protein
MGPNQSIFVQLHLLLTNTTVTESPTVLCVRSKVKLQRPRDQAGRYQGVGASNCARPPVYLLQFYQRGIL